MANRTRVDMSDLGSSSKRSDAGASSSKPGASKSSGGGGAASRNKSIAMMAGLIVLLGAVALVYGWEFIFPDKVSQDDIAPPPDPDAPPQPPPPPPSDPNNPDSNLPPGIISG